MGSKWQMEKHNDPYYKRAKQEDYRSRASYKLKQLDKKFKIIKEGNTVVDLGAAPGGWSQVALEKVGEEGMVVGVDLNRFKKFHEENYYGMRGDFTTPEVQEKIMKIIGGKAKVVMSDASPSLSGIKNIDQLRSIDLTNAVIGIADNILEFYRVNESDKGVLIGHNEAAVNRIHPLDSKLGSSPNIKDTRCRINAIQFLSSNCSIGKTAEFRVLF